MADDRRWPRERKMSPGMMLGAAIIAALIAVGNLVAVSTRWSDDRDVAPQVILSMGWIALAIVWAVKWRRMRIEAADGQADA